MSKPIGTYLGDGRVEINDYGLQKFIGDNLKSGEIITTKELIKRINKKAKEE